MKLWIAGILLMFLFLTGWIGLNLWAYDNCECGKFGTLSSDIEVVEEDGRIVALYKGQTKYGEKLIILERMRITEEWKYLFYTLIYYSDEYFVDDCNLQADMECLEGNGQVLLESYDNPVTSGFDSILKAEFPEIGDCNKHLAYQSSISTIPDSLEEYLYNSQIVNKYYLVKKYQENIDQIASIPFYEKIDSGPFLNCD